MRLVWGLNDAVQQIVMATAGLNGSFDNCVTAAVVDKNDRILAGIVFHNWCPETGVIEVSMGSIDSRCAQRGIFRKVFDYVFKKAGCQVAVFRTAQDNQRMRRLLKAFGGNEYIIPRLRGRTASEALITITDDAWYESKFAR